DPHTKAVKLDAEKIAKYLDSGAQPSDRAAKLLQKGGIKLPAWVGATQPRQGTVRNPEKRRSTRPADAEASAEAEASATPAPTEPAGDDSPAATATEETPAESPSPETAPAEDTVEEAPEPAAEAEKPAE
ncbi:MAG TPA: hypothetical protein VFK97_03505, partial [Candidatus Saccharimonadales bacterium]|nr:hypothetical protein [Candidatus Saccharimonadales bacterium]